VRLVFINTTHPSTPHISGVRAWRFSEELARSGHQVVLICAARESGHTANGNDLDKHDWRKPYVLACDPGGTNRAWGNKLPVPVRKAVTGFRMLLYGGEMTWWTEEAETAALRLFENFHPDVIWATFGRMEAVVVARRIARAARCPWVLDIKDNWELYVPAGLRGLMAVRTKGCAAVTANSCFNKHKARIWQGAEATVIYSGVDSAFFGDRTRRVSDPGHFRINLIGCLYHSDRLGEFFRGVNHWVGGLDSQERNKPQIYYIGGDIDLFREIASRVHPAIEVGTTGYISVSEMARHCRHAALNVYITHGANFHHKLLELLSCGRPVLAYPTESEESRVLARHVGGELLTPATPAAVASELARLHERWRVGDLNEPPLESAREFSWAAQSARLEKVLEETASKRHGAESTDRNDA
jgi:glycosyltransferase involved in cell wall biosynthesis